MYWKLPAQFTGNKLGSYGGNLEFTLSNAPEISQDSILEEPLVEIKVRTKKRLFYPKKMQKKTRRKSKSKFPRIKNNNINA